MAAIQIFPLEVWTSQITQASIPANNNSLRVQVIEAPAIAIQSTPPGSPSEDDMYIIDTGPTGAWSSFDVGNVVIFKGGTWLEFEKFNGWVKSVGPDVYVYNGTNWVVFAVGPSLEPWTYLYLSSDFSHNTTTYTDITGITFSAQANARYEIECFGAYQSTANTNGLGIKAQGPTDSQYIGKIEIFTNVTLTSGAYQFSETTPTSVTTGVTTANTNSPVEGRFLVATSSTSGDIKLQLRSEVNAQTITLQSALFYVRYRKLP